MNSVNGIRKYYIGFGVLMLLAITCLVYVLLQASSAKADKQTNKTVGDLSIKIDNYIASHGSVPDSLESAGISNVPSTVQYTRLSSDQYKVCLNYKSASSGFDAGWGSLLFGGAFDSSGSIQSNSDHSYFDSTVQYKHKKGQNCQTVKSYDYNLNNYNSSFQSNLNSTNSSDCYGSTSSYDVYGSAKITGINTSTKHINLDPSGQYLYDTSGKALPTISTLGYDSKTLFCNSGVKNADVSALQVGKTVQIYLKSADSTTLSRVDFY